MKKTKLTEKPIRVASPFDTTSHKTERTANQKFVEWINQIISDHISSITSQKLQNKILQKLQGELFESFEKADVAGTTYKDTYFIKRQNCFDESLHFHELVHVVQWDYLGVEKFLLAYALGLINHGYVNSPLEVMAYGLKQYFIQNPDLFAVEDVIRSELDAIMPSTLDKAFKREL